MRAISSNLVSSELRALVVSDCEAKVTRDFPGIHIFSTAHLNNRLPSPERARGRCPKELQPRILDCVHAKNIIQRLNDVQDAALHRRHSRLR